MADEDPPAEPSAAVTALLRAAHFFAIAAPVMRQVLVDHARGGPGP